MVQISTLLSALTAMAVVGSAFAHSGPPSAAELEFKRNARRSLTACQSQLRKRDGYVERAIARRQARAESIRKARGLSIGSFSVDHSQAGDISRLMRFLSGSRALQARLPGGSGY